MMTAGTRQRGRPFGAIARILLPLVLAMSVTVLFSMVWQSAAEESDFAALERDGVRYLQALGPLEIALTNAESTAVNGGQAQPETLSGAVAAVTRVDDEIGTRLGTDDRWSGLQAKIKKLPTEGDDTEIIAAYAGVNDLLLTLMDKVRNSSQLVRDPEADIFYLGDGAGQELPEAIIAATTYTNLLVRIADLPAAERAAALVDLNAAGSTLASNAQDISDDVRLAVEGTGSKSLGSALLTKLDRFNQSIDNLTPLMTPVLAGRNTVDPQQVATARDEMQSSAEDLTAAILAQIDVALQDRLSSLTQRRVVAAGAFLIAVLLAFTPIGLTLYGRWRKSKAKPEQNQPPKPQHAPAHSAPDAPSPWPVDQMPAQWPDPRPNHASDPEHARWERFGVPQ